MLTVERCSWWPLDLEDGPHLAWARLKDGVLALVFIGTHLWWCHHVSSDGFHETVHSHTVTVERCSCWPLVEDGPHLGWARLKRPVYQLMTVAVAPEGGRGGFNPFARGPS